MRIVSVVGARPQFVKLGAISRALAPARSVEHVIIHTGQHYDPDMSDSFFEELRIPHPDINLGIGSGSHGVQTGRMLEELDPLLNRIRPVWTLVYGDTNSTLAATLAAVKLDIQVAHLEAGLRSFNRAMPEEHNRVLSDHASDLLLAPTELAVQNLRMEGLGPRTVLVGDVMADVCYSTRDLIGQAELAHVRSDVGGDRYVLATIHRPSNTDDPHKLRQILRALRSLTVPVLLAVHPRLRSRAAEFGLSLEGGSVIPTSPLSYRSMVAAVMGAQGVVTDSGGLQKEAFLLGVPCTTVRAETEWVETLDGGWNILDPSAENLTELATRDKPEHQLNQPYGDGRAAERVFEVLSRGNGN